MNEPSFGKYTEPNALWVVFQIVIELTQANVGFSFFRDDDFFQGGEFKAAFNRSDFGDPLKKAAVRDMVFSSKNFSNWRPNRTSQATEVYRCIELDELFSNDSQCESAEIKIQKISDCFLLTCEETLWSKFRELQFQRNGQDAVTLCNIHTRHGALTLLGIQAGYYDPASTEPPRDFQTVLIKQTGRFQRTGKIERDGRRQVYAELETGYFYYVDNLHFGLEAHLEVFDRHERHLGRADIDNGILDRSEQKAGREINW